MGRNASEMPAMQRAIYALRGRATIGAVMAPERQPELARDHFTVVAEPLGRDAWHLTVKELPDTWTVAFSIDELEDRARQRIALDQGTATGDFDLTVVRVMPLFIERRANRRGAAD